MTTRTRRQPTEQQREQRRTEQRDLMTAAIEQLRTSVGWQAYLRTRVVFRGYSPRNVLLISSQHPTATRVAGFRAWLKLDWAVRKGEKAIKIWAPCPPSKAQLAVWRKAGADPDDKPRTYWRLACVFAQDQVQQLPPPAVPAPLEVPIAAIEGDSHHDYLARLQTLADQLGYRVSFCDTRPAEGKHYADRKLIEICDELTANGQLAAGVHELGHALVALEDDAPDLSYAEEELIVESVAWSVCQTVGLSTDANSIPYLASWAQAADLAVLERAATLTGQIADRIENGLLAADEPQGE